MSKKQTIKGSEAVIRSLLKEGVDTIFGYPGGAIMPVYDALYDYRDKVNHILARHEQGAIHAAQGYARVTGKVGVCFATSGPGATNTITGVADAMIDSTPLVIITGQVASPLLGTDAFQEVDVVGISQPVTKWCHLVKSAEEIPDALARAFHIASTGRPGPVVIDIAKDAQIGEFEFNYKKIHHIRSYTPIPKTSKKSITAAAEIINKAKKPLILLGQGVVIGNAEKEFRGFVEKTGIPVASTLLGLSALPTNHPLYTGMLGMHGNLAPNIKTNECDVLIAVGMRFDDRVTGDVNSYAKQAKIIHLEIDPAEVNKIIPVDVAILGDVKKTLPLLTEVVNPNTHEEWLSEFKICYKKEFDVVINDELHPTEGDITMGEVIDKVSDAFDNDAIIVTDVGQQQMLAARYSKYRNTRSFVTSGGLGTMGFGLPAAIGAKIGQPDRQVCAFIGDGGIQMTIQELGTIFQSNINVKIIVLNNNFLGMVRQWQELFFDKRYSFTELINPDFQTIVKGYGIKTSLVSERKDLDAAIQEMAEHDGPYFLEVNVAKEGNVFPMVPTGASVSDIRLK